MPSFPHRRLTPLKPVKTVYWQLDRFVEFIWQLDRFVQLAIWEGSHGDIGLFALGARRRSPAGWQAEGSGTRLKVRLLLIDAVDLVRRGHRVVAVDPGANLVALARGKCPSVAFVGGTASSIGRCTVHDDWCC